MRWQQIHEAYTGQLAREFKTASESLRNIRAKASNHTAHKAANQHNAYIDDLFADDITEVDKIEAADQRIDQLDQQKDAANIRKKREQIKKKQDQIRKLQQAKISDRN